jgi:hypothetical protein
MERPFGDLEQVADVVETQAWPESAEVASLDLKGRQGGPAPATVKEGLAQKLVDYRPEGLSRAPNFGLEPRRHILVERESSAHILMLVSAHQDVNL